MNDGKAMDYKGFIAVLLLLIYLLLCMLKAIIGIMGSSESLVASSLYTLFSSFVVLKLIFADKSNICVRKSFRLAGLVIGLILVFGIFDVLVFSIIRIFRASQGLLVEPSWVADSIAVVAIAVNGYFYARVLQLERENIKTRKYEAFIGESVKVKEKGFEEIVSSKIGEFKDVLMMSIIVPLLVILGCLGARFISVYFDALAALCIIIIILAPRVFVMMKETVKDCFSTVEKYGPVKAGV